ncbi:UNVERIFIED_CONTAM: hypothetical protein K2H54_058173 [Gekko kuhli]
MEGEQDQADVPRLPQQGTSLGRDRLINISSEHAEIAFTITSLTNTEKEEGEWSGDETEVKLASSRLFQMEHFQWLLSKNPEVSPLVLKRTLLKMKCAAEFAVDASQDNIQFCTRAQAANIIIRRNIWFKNWKVDTLSKSNLATEKFSDRLLFGESDLDKILVETKEEEKAMPSSFYRRERDTKPRTSHSFRGHYNAGGQDTRDHRSFKYFKYGMRNGPKHAAAYRP